MDSPLIHKLNAVRRRHAAVAAGTAGVGVTGLGVLCLAAGMLFDRWLELPYAVRAVLLSLDVAGAVAMLVWRGLLPVVRGPDVERAALWVERAEPAFASRLVSAVQFLQPAGVPAGTSAGMVRALVRQTEAAADAVDFTAVVPTRGLKRLAALAAAVLAVVGGGFVYGGRTSVALAERALLVRGVESPRRTRITVVSGDVTVAVGDPVTLSAMAAGVVPADGRVAVRSGSAAGVDLPVAGGAGGRFDRPIDNVQEPFSYRFTIGDNRSAEYQVRTVVRPAVLGVRCRVTAPAYTGVAAGERSPWDLSVLAGSELGLTVTASVPCGGRVRFTGAAIDVPLTADLNTATVLHLADTMVPPAATGFTVELVDAAGVGSRDPAVYRIETLPDRPPTVRLTAPAADVTVTPVARPAVAVEADDDFGVARLSLRYRITKAGQTAATDDDPNGLTGTYGADPGVSRVDPDLDVGWAATPPPAGVGRRFAVRWVGSIRPAVSDEYQFVATFTGGVRVSVAGRLLIDRPGEPLTDVAGGPVHLQAGRLYPITVDCPAAGDGEARLSWRSRRVPFQVVPHACLFRRATAYEPPADADGLVGYWPLDDDADDGYARDAAGAADGTVFDAARVPGRLGRAVAFDVAPDRKPNRHVEVPDGIAFQYRADESYTLAGWVNLQRVTGRWQGVVTKGRDGGPRYGLWVDPAGRFAAASAGGNLVGPLATPGWHHVAVAQDGPVGQRTLSVDGLAVVSGKSQDGSGPGPLVFGNVGNGGEPFDGWLDDLRLYARAVPAEQLRAMWADPRPVHMPTPAEVGGLAGGTAATVALPFPGRPARHVERRFAWDLAALASPPAVGDTIDVWAEAADGNTVTGPGVATSEHRRLRVVDEAEKRQELLGRLGDYLGRVRDVSDEQRDLTAQVAALARPTTGPVEGNKDQLPTDPR